jgi:hypothetical protein
MERLWSHKGFVVGPDEAAPVWLRVGLVVFSLVLTAQAIWILLAEFQHPRRIRVPVDQRASVDAALDSAQARRAAKLAVVRGDLWAESAFTYSSPLWTDEAASSTATIDEARVRLERALRFSPHRGDVWLLLAAMADRYDWKGPKPSSLLKMSYYTAPNEQALFLLRIKVSLRAAGQDPELPDMIGRDIRLLITRMPAEKPAFVAVYKAASGASKRFVERVVSEVDPAYLAAMRAGSQ